MIKGYRDKDTELVAGGYVAKRLPRDMQKAARRKLDQLAVSKTLDGMRMPPGNRLEALKGSRAGQYSVRINDQWRICFRWEDGHAHDVEIADYH